MRRTRRVEKLSGRKLFEIPFRGLEALPVVSAVGNPEASAGQKHPLHRQLC